MMMLNAIATTLIWPCRRGNNLTAAQKHRRLFALHSLSGVLSAALVCAACGTSSCFGQVPDFRNLPPEERIKQMRENARIKAQEALLQYERGVQMLRADKERDPVKYENMILCVAFSAAQAGEKGRADEAFDEAFGLYQDNPLKVCPNGTDQRFWSYLSAHATASDFDLKFPILLRLSENRRRREWCCAESRLCQTFEKQQQAPNRQPDHFCE